MSDNDHIDRCYITDGNGQGNGPIAKIIRRGAPWSSEAGRKSDLANAHLIAAAPALLEALKNCLSVIEFMAAEVGRLDAVRGSAGYGLARAAIAAAMEE